MILIGLVCFIGGFFFPPLWLGVIACVVYAVATAKRRRRNEIERRIRSMVAQGVPSATFSRIYFDAAKAYATEMGAASCEHDLISIQLSLDGRSHHVTFQREAGGGTTVGVDEFSELDAAIEADIKSLGIPNEGIQSTESELDRGCAEALATLRDDMVVTFLRLDEKHILEYANMLAPDWTADAEKVQTFCRLLFKRSVQKGIAVSYVMMIGTWAVGDDADREALGMDETPDSFELLPRALLAFAEEQGWSFDQQCHAVFVLVETLWERLSPGTRARAERADKENEGFVVIRSRFESGMSA